MSELTKDDHRQILEYYHQPVPYSARIAKIQAEKILSTKLCRCIKKADRRNEKRAIGICTKSIINRKGFKRGAFRCKTRSKIVLYKGTRTRRRRGTRRR